MKNIRKICVVTGTRAEYGLLYWLMKELEASVDLELQIIATGMHLSPEFGLTYKHIQHDGFNINRKIEMLLSSDTSIGVSKSMGLGLIGFSEAYSELAPDLIVVLGDRFEILVAATAATVSRIPIVHLHGGETTEGAFDEVFRHSITKMSHLHFTSNERYRHRVIQLGEHPDRVFNFGALGLENIRRLRLLEREELEQAMNFRFGDRNFLVTFHPVTLEQSTAEEQFGNLLKALDELTEVRVIFTKSNADPGGRIINKMIDQFVAERSETTCAFLSLGQVRYLSALRFVNAVVGNSSSGLIEAPSFRIGTINIGDRQRGRIKADSVIDCEPSLEGIRSAFAELCHSDFLQKLSDVSNPYGEGDVVRRIIRQIRKQDFRRILKKRFFDVPIQEI